MYGNPNYLLRLPVMTLPHPSSKEPWEYPRRTVQVAKRSDASDFTETHDRQHTDAQSDRQTDHNRSHQPENQEARCTLQSDGHTSKHTDAETPMEAEGGDADRTITAKEDDAIKDPETDKLATASNIVTAPKLDQDTKGITSA
jgi:hypothetical protein